MQNINIWRYKIIRLPIKISGIFFCFTLLIIGTIVLLKDMSIDYNTVITACQFSILGAIIAGIFGFFIGKILEMSKTSSENNSYNNSRKYVIKEPENTEEDNDENQV